MKKLILIMAIFMAFAFTSSTYAQRDVTPRTNVFHSDFTMAKIAFNDSTYMDSTKYPFITSTFDASWITGQVDSLVISGSNALTFDKQGIIYRAQLCVPCPTGVTCTPTLDTVWGIVQTKDEGGYRWVDCDTITILGSAVTAAPTEGMFTFSNWPREIWRMRFEEKKTPVHTNFTNRNGDYILISITSENTDMIAPKLNPGNF